jgi:hypothetical protein
VSGWERRAESEAEVAIGVAPAGAPRPAAVPPPSHTLSCLFSCVKCVARSLRRFHSRETTSFLAMASSFHARRAARARSSTSCRAPRRPAPAQIRSRPPALTVRLPALIARRSPLPLSQKTSQNGGRRRGASLPGAGVPRRPCPSVENDPRPRASPRTRSTTHARPPLPACPPSCPAPARPRHYASRRRRRWPVPSRSSSTVALTSTSFST